MTLILPSRHECVGVVASSSRTWTYQSFGSTLASSATPSTKVGGAGLRETVVENWARETTVENKAENSAGNPLASKAAAPRPPGVQGLSNCGSIDSRSFAAIDQTGRRTDAPSNRMLSRAKLYPATSPASWKTRLPGGRTRLECPPFLMFTLLQVTPSKSSRVGEHVPNGTTFQKPRFAQHPSVECGDADAWAYKVCIFCPDGPFPSLQIRECGFRSLSRILA
jgi:hypothetical protein